MNTVHLVGRIATAIRIQEFPSKKGADPMTKATFLLAVSPPIKNGKTDWVSVETWNGQATNLVRYNGRGSLVAVKGRLNSRFYNPNGGERGGSLRPVVVADEIDYLGQPKAAAPVPAATKESKR